jgi:hypothetical protein
MSATIDKHKLGDAIVVIVNGRNIRGDMFEAAGGRAVFSTHDGTVGYFACPDDADIFAEYLQLCLSKKGIDKHVKVEKGSDIISARITKPPRRGTIPVVEYKTVVEGNDAEPTHRTHELTNEPGMGEVMEWLRKKETYIFNGGNHER